MSAVGLTEEESVQVEGLDGHDEVPTEVLGHQLETEPDFQPDNEELPPDYDSLASPLPVTVGEEHLQGEFVDGAVERQKQSSTLIAEAPPSYKQLFGNEEETIDGSGKERRPSRSRRPHTRPRRSSHLAEGREETDLLSQLSKRFSNIKTATLGLAGFVAALYALSLAMVIVGALNISVCQSVVVPIYLTVAGVIQLSSLVFQTVTWSAEKCGVEKCGAIRVFDLFGFLLFIWLIIGSNWIVRVGWSRSACNDNNLAMDYVSMVNVNSTLLGGDYEAPPESDGDVCRDCASQVYLFTSVIIVLQYIMVILVCMSCCSVLYRSRSSPHRSRSRRRH